MGQRNTHLPGTSCPSGWSEMNPASPAQSEEGVIIITDDEEDTVPVGPYTVSETRPVGDRVPVGPYKVSETRPVGDRVPVDPYKVPETRPVGDRVPVDPYKVSETRPVGDRVPVGPYKVPETRPVGDRVPVGPYKVPETRPVGDRVPVGPYKVPETRPVGDRVPVGPYKVPETRPVGDRVPVGPYKVSETRPVGDRVPVGPYKVSETRPVGDRVPVGPYKVPETRPVGDRVPVGPYKVSETSPVGDTPVSSGHTQGADHRTQINRKRGQDLTSKRADPDPCQGHPSGYGRVTECPPTKRPRLDNVQQPPVKEDGRKHIENPHEDKLSASKKRAKDNHKTSKEKAKGTHKTTKGKMKDTHITSKGKPDLKRKTSKGTPALKRKTPKEKAKDTHKTSKGKAKDTHKAPKGNAKDTHKTPKGKAKDTHKTPKGKAKDTHKTSKGKAKDTHKAPKGNAKDTHKTPKGKAKDTHKTSNEKAKNTHKTPKGKAKDTHKTPKEKAKDTHKIPKGKAKDTHKTSKGKPEANHKTSKGKAKDIQKTSKGKPNLKRKTLNGKAKDKHKLQDSSLSTSKGKANGNTNPQASGSSRYSETSCAAAMRNAATEHSNDTTSHGHSLSAPSHQPAANPDSQHDVGQIAFTKFYSTCSGLLTGESAKLLVFIKKRYYTCSETCRNSAAMVELLEVTMAKMQLDPKIPFVHIKECTSKLKAWGTKNDLTLQRTAESPLVAVAEMSQIEDSTSEGSGMEGTLQGTLGSGSAPPLSTASPACLISPSQSEAMSSQQPQSDLNSSTGPLHEDLTKGPVCESAAAEHVARCSPSASREVVTSSGDAKTLLHQGAPRSSSITMSTQSKLEVKAASKSPQRELKRKDKTAGSDQLPSTSKHQQFPKSVCPPDVSATDAQPLRATPGRSLHSSTLGHQQLSTSACCLQSPTASNIQQLAPPTGLQHLPLYHHHCGSPPCSQQLSSILAVHLPPSSHPQCRPAPCCQQFSANPGCHPSTSCNQQSTPTPHCQQFPAHSTYHPHASSHQYFLSPPCNAELHSRITCPLPSCVQELPSRHCCQQVPAPLREGPAQNIMGTNLRVSEERDVGQEKATASTDASSTEDAETQEVRTTPHEPTEEELDPDQQAVVERWEDEMMIVNAGPGSGKTFTLCKLIERIRQERPESRVLVLAYNRYAVSELRARLMNYGVFLLEDNVTAYRSTDEGCLVATFHSFAHESSDSGKVFKKDKKYFDITFKENVESLKRKARDSPTLTWDWVIVDEGQDVTPDLAELVDTLLLTCRHFVVAGDPRQAIRKGATWFSDLWRLLTMEPHRAKLRFNHRSGPELVKFLNDYSRENFESYDLHYDQISLRKKQATVEMVTKIKSNMGEIIGRRLLQSPPDKAYALTPASLEKWTNGQVTQSIAKTLSDQGSELQKIENLNDGRVPATNVYTAGTVCSLKGTERSRVVVYGVSRSYQPTIQDELLHKLIFVAISRARDHLHIILDKNLPDKNPLKPFEEKKTEAKPQKYSKLKVTDLAGEHYRWWVVKEPLSRPCLDQDRVPKQGVNIGLHGDPGFVGLYVESVIAYLLGCNISDAKVNDLLSQVSNLNDEVKGPKKNKPKGGFISQLQKNFLDVQKVNPCFAFAPARRSLQDGTIYEDKDQIAGQWERHQEVCQPFTDFLHSHIQCPQYQEYLCLAITPDRSSKEVGNLVGIADFVGKTSLVEIKHVSEIRREHRVQTAIYGAMSLQCKEALLVNLKDADIKTVTAVDPVELVHFARAKLALKNCQSRKRIHQNDCLIAVSTVRNESNEVGEIGAVAFSLAGDILGTYHRIMPGVEEAPEGHRLPRDSRFSLVFQQARLLAGNANIFQKQQEKVFEGFHQWFHFMRDNGVQCRFAFWDEEDAKILKLGELSHNPVHLPSLLPEGSSRDSELSLSGWVEKLLGDDWPYEAHRAFEDAVAVAALKLLL